MLLQLFTWDVIDQKIMSDWGWKRNDSDDEIAREIYESVIHVRKLYTAIVIKETRLTHFILYCNFNFKTMNSKFELVLFSAQM